MKRFFLNATPCCDNQHACMDTDEAGDFVEYEEVYALEIDRDIKAANLQLLVNRVLAWSVQDSVFQIAPEVQDAFAETIELARSLKQ